MGAETSASAGEKTRGKAPPKGRALTKRGGLRVGAPISVQYPGVGGKAYRAIVGRVRKGGTVDVKYPATRTAEDFVAMDRITLRFPVETGAAAGEKTGKTPPKGRAKRAGLRVGAPISVQYPGVGGKAYRAIVGRVRKGGTVDVKYPATRTAEDFVAMDRITLRFDV